ncbi:hypothetical protein CMQ_6761 [Grosmannia clavigera kw1407]|uniref:Uncharacterized protein n=1 Tax=Grosmannia clavigera (strain kw1407 / UAMH 11150) TaxID=655863 RepID=F0X6Q7_GROCL|nr:uncharacterized protein CMQ_6761 [Grosmannia clavigera kw1407]EFX06440.1 hypothetical protein CMQ_6761 [Grosmannia clavigera kw1407]
MPIGAAKEHPDLHSTVSETLSRAVPRDTLASSTSSSELTSVQIGGIVGGLVGMLVVCVAITIWVIRHLRKTAATRQNASSRRSAQRRSAHGSGGGGSGGSGEYSGSGIRTSHHKIVPTPSQVDQLDYADLLERETTATLAGGHTPSISGLSHTPTVGSSHAVVTPVEESALPNMLGSTMNSPGQSISGDRVGSGAVRFSNLPHRSQNRPTWRSSSSVGADCSSSVDSSSHRRQSAWQRLRQAHLLNGGSISSAASSSNRGTCRRPAELGVDGGFIPELPAASQEGEEAMRASSNWASSTWTRFAPAAARAHAVSGVSAISGFSAASVGMQQTPDSKQYSGYIPSPMHSRDHSGSSASFHQGSPRLDIVTENLDQDLHGHYGPTHAVAGQTLAGNIVNVDISTPIDPW